MENLSPIIFLIIYLVISSFSKRRKNAQQESAGRSSGEDAADKRPSALRSILEGLESLGQESSQEPSTQPRPEVEKDVGTTAPAASSFWGGAQLRQNETNISAPPVGEIFNQTAGGELREDLPLENLDADPYKRPVDKPYDRGEESSYQRPVEMPYENLGEEFYRPGSKRSVLGRKLKDMPILKKGILLQTILGPPRSLQPPDDWFKSE